MERGLREKMHFCTRVLEEHRWQTDFSNAFLLLSAEDIFESSLEIELLNSLCKADSDLNSLFSFHSMKQFSCFSLTNFVKTH